MQPVEVPTYRHLVTYRWLSRQISLKPAREIHVIDHSVSQLPLAQTLTPFSLTTLLTLTLTLTLTLILILILTVAPPTVPGNTCRGHDRIRTRSQILNLQFLMTPNILH